MDEHRYFNWSQKNEIFNQANGKCERCQSPLDDGWHAHHKIRWSDGGETKVSNGMAVCSSCHIILEREYIAMDHIDYRSFQSEGIAKAIYNYQSGNRRLIALPYCGAGKTLLALAIGNEFYRRGWIDTYIHLTPRQNLCSQVEIEWKKDWSPKLMAPKMGKITWRENKSPILRPGYFGYTTTYAALTANPDLHFKALGNRKVMAVFDEAQQLGVDGDNPMATTQAVDMLSDLTEFDIIMTATETRADGNPLWHCDYTDPDEKGERHLKYDVLSSYRDGVSQRFLRQFDFQAIEGAIIREYFDPYRDDETLTLSEIESGISAILQKPSIWKPIVDATIEQLKYVRRHTWNGYRGFLPCVNQPHAGAVHDYIGSKHQDMVSILAISDDGNVAQDNLKSFKRGHGDILTSVSMVAMGYSYKPITVIGYLSARRHPGFTGQIIGRGLRVDEHVPFETQCLYGIVPADKLMMKFARGLRADSRLGLKEKVDRGGDGPQTPLGFFKSAEITGSKGIGLRYDGDTNEVEYRILDSQNKKNDIIAPINYLASLIRRANGDITSLDEGVAKPQEIKVRDFTEKELLEARRSELSRFIGQAAAAWRKSQGWGNSQEEKGRSNAKVRGFINAKYGITNIEEVTPETLEIVLYYASKDLFKDVKNGQIV